MIPYYRLSKDQAELEALKDVYANGNWATGVSLSELEITLKLLLNKKHIVLTSNGYSALFVVIKALGLKEQQVIVPAVSTCFAISNAVIATGNIPLFCDVNLSDGNCNLESVSELCKQTNARYIIAPNHAGNLSEMKKFQELGLTVIEDSCQSFFSSIGKINRSDIQVFSFYPTKGINGIDGGVIATNDPQIATEAKKLVYYDDQEAFENSERYNFRFLNICAAIALANLKRMDDTKKKLNIIKGVYHTIMKRQKGISILENKEQNVTQRYVVFISDADLKNKLVDHFKQGKISLSPFFTWTCPLNEKGKFKNAMKLIENTFCLPYYEDLTNKELETIQTTLISATS